MPDQQSWLTTLGQAFARPDTSQEHVRFTTASPLVNITDEDINRGINVALSAGPGSVKGAIPRLISDIDPASKVALGRLFRGTEASVTPEAAMTRSGPGDIGHGVYVTPNETLAKSFGGGPAASVTKGSRAVHSFESSSLFPEDVAYVFGGSKIGEPVQLVSGNGIPLWKGEWSGANIENALKDSGIRAVIGTPDSIGVNQIAIRDPSLLRPTFPTSEDAKLADTVKKHGLTELLKKTRSQ